MVRSARRREFHESGTLRATNTRVRAERQAKRIGEIEISCDGDSPIGSCPRLNEGIRMVAKANVPRVDDIMTGPDEGLYHCTWKGLVNEETSQGSRGSDSHDLLTCEPGSIPQGRARLVVHEVVFGPQLGFVDAGRQLAEDQSNRDPRACDDRLPECHSRVSRDARDEFLRHDSCYHGRNRVWRTMTGNPSWDGACRKRRDPRRERAAEQPRRPGSSASRGRAALSEPGRQPTPTALREKLDSDPAASAGVS